MDNKKLNAEELASKLEAKANLLREKGLTQEDLGKAAGGFWWLGCCGSNCVGASSTSTCKASCIMSSSD